MTHAPATPASAPGVSGASGYAAGVAPPAERDALAVASYAPLWLAAGTLWRREIIRFLRQRSRIVGALATPLLIWLLLGSGLNRSFVAVPASGGAGGGSGGGAVAAPGAGAPAGYLEYFYPGTIVLVLLFTAIFSTVSVIEDRREGFMQGVLVAPISRLAVVLGKVLGGATLATVQGVLLLLLWPLVGHWAGLGPTLLSVAVMAVLAAGLTGLGLCLVWPMESIAGFHAIMNLLLMPMWFLSGAMFPLTPETPRWLRAIMAVNPLTYGYAAFTGALHGGRAPAGGPVPWAASLAITVGFTLGVCLLAARMVARPRKDGRP